MVPRHDADIAAQVQTVNDCGKIRAECQESRATDRRWQIGIMVTVLLAVIASTIGFAMTNARTDATQDVRINMLEKTVENTDAKFKAIMEALAALEK